MLMSVGLHLQFVCSRLWHLMFQRSFPACFSWQTETWVRVRVKRHEARWQLEPWQTELKESSQTEHQKSQVSPEWLGSLDTKKNNTDGDWWWIRWFLLLHQGLRPCHQQVQNRRIKRFQNQRMVPMAMPSRRVHGIKKMQVGMASVVLGLILEWWVSSWGEWIDSYQFPKHYAEQAALQKTTVRSPGLQCLTKQSSFGNSKPVGPIWSNLPTNLNPISMNQPHVMSNIILGGFRWNMIIYDMIRL